MNQPLPGPNERAKTSYGEPVYLFHRQGRHPAAREERSERRRRERQGDETGRSASYKLRSKVQKRRTGHF